MRKAMKQRIAFSAWHRVRQKGAGGLTAVAAGLLVWMLLGDTAFCQFGGPFGGRRWMNGGFDSEYDTPTDAFLPVDREVTRQWEKAKSLVEQGNYSDAATLLDEILRAAKIISSSPTPANRTIAV